MWSPTTQTTSGATVASVAWTDVLGSEQLPGGSLVIIELASREVVVWRSASGVVSGCDARCPHQWAHLGTAGVVDGDVLVCRSHGWCFDTDGAGFKSSVSGRRDEKSPLDLVGVRELAGRIELDLDEGVIRVVVPGS